MSLTISCYGILTWRNEKGQCHREKGPAVIYTNGHIEFFFNNELHRLNGPAIIKNDGYKQYWICDKQYIKEEYLDKVKKLWV